MQILLIIFESFIEKQMGIGKIPNSSWKVKWITLSTSNYCPTQQLHHHPSPPPPSLPPLPSPPPPALPKKKVCNNKIKTHQKLLCIKINILSYGMFGFVIEFWRPLEFCTRPRIFILTRWLFDFSELIFLAMYLSCWWMTLFVGVN